MLKNRRGMEVHGVVLALACGAAMVGCIGTANAHDGLSATAEVEPLANSGVKGVVRFTQHGDKVYVAGSFEGLTPGRHGIHIHTNGNCDSADGSSAGGHFSPAGGQHGGPSGKVRHLGDLGNIEADSSGRATFQMEAEGVTTTLMGTNSVVGRSLIVHADPDDLSSQPAGNSGKRVACGIIEQDMMAM